MAGSHPLFNIDHVLNSASLVFDLAILVHEALVLGITLEIAPEVLKESDLLLQLLRVLGERILLADILPVTRSALHVVEVVSIWV